MTLPSSVLLFRTHLWVIFAGQIYFIPIISYLIKAYIGEDAVHRATDAGPLSSEDLFFIAAPLLCTRLSVSGQIALDSESQPVKFGFFSLCGGQQEARPGCLPGPLGARWGLEIYGLNHKNHNWIFKEQVFLNALCRTKLISIYLLDWDYCEE